MDCEIPLLDGYAASRRILFRKESPAPTIIALTAHAMEGTEIKYLRAGMKKVLTKPVSMEQLKNVLEEIKEEKLAL
jgi:CheY-like chemotaxis protein